MSQEMSEALRKRRDELEHEYFKQFDNVLSPIFSGEAYENGFSACYQEMAPLIEALEQHAEEVHFQSGIEYTFEANVELEIDARAKHAREALKKVRGNV